MRRWHLGRAVSCPRGPGPVRLPRLIDGGGVHAVPQRIRSCPHGDSRVGAGRRLFCARCRPVPRARPLERRGHARRVRRRMDRRVLAWLERRGTHAHRPIAADERRARGPRDAAPRADDDGAESGAHVCGGDQCSASGGCALAGSEGRDHAARLGGSVDVFDGPGDRPRRRSAGGRSSCVGIASARRERCPAAGDVHRQRRRQNDRGNSGHRRSPRRRRDRNRLRWNPELHDRRSRLLRCPVGEGCAGDPANVEVQNRPRAQERKPSIIASAPMPRSSSARRRSRRCGPAKPATAHWRRGRRDCIP